MNNKFHFYRGEISFSHCVICGKRIDNIDPDVVIVACWGCWEKLRLEDAREKIWQKYSLSPTEAHNIMFAILAKKPALIYCILNETKDYT